MGQRDTHAIDTLRRTQGQAWLISPITKAQDKPFYQIIKLDQAGGGTGGVTRSFLGLMPGHTYKVTIRLNTMKMLSSDANWAYSFHAVCGGANVENLTTRQMAGLDALPDGTKGESAGRVVQYGPQKSTMGQYQEAVKKLTLPEGADTITVWLRLRATKPGAQVAMDYIKLEDLGQK